MAGAPTLPPNPEKPRRRGPVGRFLWRHVHPFVAPALERLSALAALVERQGHAREDLRTHLETRIDQAVGEVAELRTAFLTMRAEFEGVRDARISAVERNAETAHRALEVLQGEVEQLRGSRLLRAEQDLAAVQRELLALQSELEALRDSRVAELERRLGGNGGALGSIAEELRAALTNMRGELEELRDRTQRIEGDTGEMAGAISRLQEGVESLASQRLPRVQEDLAGLQRLADELRDERLPALAGRTESLVARLYEEIETTAGLLERVLAGEPLHVAVDETIEAPLPEALRASSLRFAEAFRGGRVEILGRVGDHVELLRGAGPVLDLGCGRGELLEALQSAGVEARGVDQDAAMVAACRRRGLEVEEGDAVRVLGAQDPDSLGAVTALHLFEHLPPGSWTSAVDRAARALRPGGALLVECPNPEALRVGANLFWLDPTHHSPVHRDALAFVMEACGFVVEVNRVLHPFPPEQMLSRPEQSEDVRELARRLDEWLSPPRDFLLLGRKPGP